MCPVYRSVVLLIWCRPDGFRCLPDGSMVSITVGINRYTTGYTARLGHINLVGQPVEHIG
ncbi:hypothetical protein DERF_000847 [Dermatophagoides farinae]|uniref:Uncharacterized protein n=1 Tax=Dermatophagoides farinae TaxID=6954 RepID=A0A922I889_DERFA|nr:hypothetical protein DERF_000847 [Dermatophagoides farinae]